MFKIPILFIVFIRPDTTTEVFGTIRKVKPSRLYIVADGPRKNKINEDINVQDVRNLVISNIDWDCKVKTLFRKENLGCKNSVSKGLKWFFTLNFNSSAGK